MTTTDRYPAGYGAGVVSKYEQNKQSFPQDQRVRARLAVVLAQA